MAIKVNFSGAPCYDLMQYLARVLYYSGNNVLMVDLSNDRSLDVCIPIPNDIMPGHTIDYCGVRYATNYYSKYEKEYDYILIYYGQNAITHLKAHWQFIIVSSEEQSVRNMIDEVSKFELFNITKEQTVEEEQEKLDGSMPVVLYLDMVTRKSEFIKNMLGSSIVKNYRVCELTYNDYELKLLSQTEKVKKFAKLSSEYKDLIKQCSLSLLDCEEDKEFLQKYKLAERGK